MSDIRVYITGMGVISPAGRGVKSLKTVIKENKRNLRPLSLFTVSPDILLPVGEVSEPFETLDLPRTHQLALAASQEAMADAEAPPDALHR